eukprot:9723570-Karenia_brevis.AAC.1
MKEEMSPEEVRTKLGNPAVFILNAMAQIVVEDKELVKEEMAVMIKDAMKEWTPEFVLEHMTSMRISNQYKSQFKKVEICCPALLFFQMQNPEPPAAPSQVTVEFLVSLITKALMKEKGFLRLQGPAPPGEMERKLQSFLDQE